MPELPEVETVRRGLTRLVQGATIAHVEVRYPKMVTPDADVFTAELISRKIERIDRRGKYLLFRFSGDLTMVSHLRMEGKYDVQPEGSPVSKHTHVIFHLTDNRELRYTDTRKFGRMQLVPTGEETTLAPSLGKLGPEPTAETLTLAYMVKIFGKSHKVVKPFLLDQTRIAGLGNIYADEVLWLSKINPLTPVDTLTPSQLSELRQNIIDEMALAIGGMVRQFIHFRQRLVRLVSFKISCMSMAEKVNRANGVEQNWLRLRWPSVARISARTASHYHQKQRRR